MKRKIALLLVGLVTALLMAVTFLPAAAKGPFSRVIITSSQLEQPITVSDPLALSFLSLGVLEDFQSSGALEMPADAAQIGYDLERQWTIGDNQLQTFDRVSYHPNRNSGRGYIHIVRTEVGTSNYDGKWFQATPEGEAALRAVIAGETVTCPVTRADDADVQTLLGTDPMWFTPPIVKPEIDTTESGQSPNVSGSILLSNTNKVNGDLVIGASLLQRFEQCHDPFSGRRSASPLARSP